MTETGLSSPPPAPRWAAWPTSARSWQQGCGCRPVPRGTTGSRGGIPSGGCAPTIPPPGRREHVPDAEIHWPSIAASPYAGQVWAVEVELTPKPIARTTRIMTGLLSPMRYAQVICNCPRGLPGR